MFIDKFAWGVLSTPSPPVIEKKYFAWKAIAIATNPLLPAADLTESKLSAKPGPGQPASESSIAPLS